MGIDSCKLQILEVKLGRRGERRGSYTATCRGEGDEEWGKEKGDREEGNGRAKVRGYGNIMLRTPILYYRSYILHNGITTTN